MATKISWADAMLFPMQFLVARLTGWLNIQPVRRRISKMVMVFCCFCRTIKARMFSRLIHSALPYCGPDSVRRLVSGFGVRGTPDTLHSNFNGSARPAIRGNTIVPRLVLVELKRVFPHFTSPAPFLARSPAAVIFSHSKSCFYSQNLNNAIVCLCHNKSFQNKLDVRNKTMI